MPRIQKRRPDAPPASVPTAQAPSTEHRLTCHIVTRTDTGQVSSVFGSQIFTGHGPHPLLAEADAREQALLWLAADLREHGAVWSPDQRQAYLQAIAEHKAWRDAHEAGRRPKVGAFSVWPSASDIGSSQSGPKAFLRRIQPIFAWGWGESHEEARYFQLHAVAQQLALAIRRLTDEGERAAYQQASQYLELELEQRRTTFVSSQLSWQQTLQVMADILAPEQAWRTAPQSPPGDPVAAGSEEGLDRKTAVS